MWLKTYLDFTVDRPQWAYIADDILATNVPKNCHPEEKSMRVNTFLQSWSPRQKAARDIPMELKAIIAVAKKHNLVVNALAPSRGIMKSMPMWGHTKADKRGLRKASKNDSLTVRCLKTKHRLVSVGDFVDFAGLEDKPEHVSMSDECECIICNEIETNFGCLHPISCMRRAGTVLDTLPPRWDPRGVLPEDYENNAPEDEPMDEDAIEIDRRITTHGSLSNVFRIFADDDEFCGERLNSNIEESDWPVTITTSAIGQKDSNSPQVIGAGVYVSEGNSLNSSIRLPMERKPTVQSGELSATLIATATAN
ncbi:hypothetical protein BD311DRAFT_679005, partial [Dichomitus squalens]